VSGRDAQHGPDDGPDDGIDDRGVAPGHWGTDGSWHQVGATTRRLLREAIGEPHGPATWFVEQGSAEPVWSPGEVALDPECGGGTIAVAGHLPPDLPGGVHELLSDGGHRTRLFVVPPRAPRIAGGWGWAAQLYAVRSARSWGHGDLADLADLARRSAAAGAAMVAHNPLGAPTPVAPIQPSPYYASSRRVGSPMYLAVEAVPGAELLGAGLEAAVAAGRALNELALIDHDEVWRVKLRTLEAIWAALAVRPGGRADPAAAPGADPATAFGRALRSNARFCALAERHGGGFSSWPVALRRPDTPAVAAACAELADRVAFWTWAGLEVDRQHADAAAAGVTGGGQRAGLMADLPVGFDPGGADAWADQGLLALDCRIGAPPDDFAPGGQDWGLPPYVPWRLRADAYRPWIDTLRCAMRHATALRIDHVMGLLRLYWIPEGAEPGDGGYVYGHGTELLDVAVMEAHRCGVALVGEDLGTVEPEVRDAMARRGVAGYRVAWFEDSPPQEWPSLSVGMLSTHDLPTVAGLWDGTDAEDRRAAGVRPDPGGDALLRRRLERLTAHPHPATPSVDVTRRAHAALGAAGSDLVVGTLEDLAGQAHRPNLPGTVDTHPNWRLPLPVGLEGLDLRPPAPRASARTGGARGGAQAPCPSATAPRSGFL